MHKIKILITSALAPSIELGSMWPPMGIESVNPFGIPLLNTVKNAVNNFDVDEAVWMKIPLYMLNLSKNSVLFSLLPLSIKFPLNKVFLQKYHKLTEDKNKEFYKWFVGFTDVEGSFGIFIQYKCIFFRFSIGLHIDDLFVLNFIKNKLSFGNIYTYKKNCFYNVTKKEDILKLISIFDVYHLNSTEQLNCSDWKKAYYLYNERTKLSKELIIQIQNIKKNINTQRTNFKMFQVIISRSWLYGFIEGNGSFSLNRSILQPEFTISLTESQLPLLLDIKKYLEKNLGFDSYSIYKLNSSSIVDIVNGKAVKNNKPMVSLKIINIHVLTNYLIPFLNKYDFISKKRLDFEDFKILCTCIYTGSYRNKRIKDLIIKLSYTMNNYRLSTNFKAIESLSTSERNEIIKAKATIEHLSDGREIEIGTKKLIHRRSSSCIYEIIKPSGKILFKPNLAESAKELGIGFNTLKRQLNNQLIGEKIKYNSYYIKRIAVFYPINKK